jgi:DNA-binding GntR family transcriptional regulator
MARQKGQLRLSDRSPAPQLRKRVNLFDQAYQRIEELLVNCALQPGRFLTMQDLQDLTSLGRTPVHHAVNRLAADTLIVIRPRHGLQIAPINLARERLLLKLRRDIERFVVRLATERSSAVQRGQLLELEHTLGSRVGTLTLTQFNTLDREIDRLILSAANEPFLEHTLRPLHTLFRRIGYIHHACVPGRANLGGTVERHRAVVTAIANGHASTAAAASDALIDFVDGMFEALSQEIEPALLDCSAEAPAGRLTPSGAHISPVVRTGLHQQTQA